MKRKLYMMIILSSTVILLSSFGGRHKNPPEDACASRLLKIYLTSGNYIPNPLVSFSNTQYCLPAAGQWKDPSSSPGTSWTNTANYLRMVRVEVVPKSGTCTNIGRYWYNSTVQMTTNGRCYIEVPIYTKFTNDIIVNGLSDCYLPGLPSVRDLSGQIHTFRAHYKSTFSIWGGVGGGSSLTLRMEVEPNSFLPVNGLTKC